jgi:hypothetical protein
MKSLFLAGGFAGFLLCAVAGLGAGRSADLILRDAALGCLAGALLVRWFWQILLHGFRETLRIRRRAAEEAAAAAQQNSHNGHAPPPAPIVAGAATATAVPRATPLINPKPATR